eukprot:5642799-Ditylum_brightwellii.AAC.1
MGVIINWEYRKSSFGLEDGHGAVPKRLVAEASRFKLDWGVTVVTAGVTAAAAPAGEAATTDGALFSLLMHVKYMRADALD